MSRRNEPSGVLLLLQSFHQVVMGTEAVRVSSQETYALKKRIEIRFDREKKEEEKALLVPS